MRDDHALGSVALRDVLPGPDDLDVMRVRELLQRRLLGEPAAPARIGRFHLLERVAEGGMGVVFAAFDAELDRKVAIKLLRRGREDASLRRRIVREAQAMAKLSHENVAHVYEVGEYDAHTFIAMEYVRGQTLRQWASSEPRSWRQCVALYMQAGRGLAAAHAAGLVHRDFKPDNAMVGEDGRVRVLDFGLARDDPGAAASREAADPGATITRAGAIAGTPAYMAPEIQRGAGADARSDAYSFCVSLWEAIHGERPFGGSRAVLPAWLRAVLVRGLAEDPTDRYAEMTALLAALGDDPSHRRRRVFVLAGFALAGAAVVGALALERAAGVRACEVKAATIAQAWDDQRRATLRDAILGTQLPFADDTWSRLQPRLDDYAARWSASRRDSCIAATVDTVRTADLAARSDECLAERRDALAALVDVLLATKPTPAHLALPSAYRLPRLEVCTDDAWLMHRPVPPRDADLDALAELARELTHNESAFELTQSTAGLDRARSIAAQADLLGWGPLSARALLNLGNYESAAAHYELAYASVHKAVTIAMRSGAEDVALDASTGMMVTSYSRGDLEQALWWAWLAQSLLDRTRDRDPIREVLLLGKLSGVYQQRRAFADADAVSVRALAVAEQAFGSDHPLMAWILVRLAVIRGEQGKHTEAMTLLERALAVQEATLGPDHPHLADTLGGIAATYFLLEEHASALAPLERAVAIKEAEHGSEHPVLAEPLNLLASVYAATDHHAQGLAARARALAIAELAFGPQSPDVARILVNRGAVHSDRGEYDEAMPDFERALAIFERDPATTMDVGLVLGNIAEVHDLRGDPKRALTIFPRAIDLLAQTLGEDHTRVASNVEKAGRAHEHAGDPVEAIRHAERALAICERADCSEAQRASAAALLARVRIAAQQDEASLHE